MLKTLIKKELFQVVQNYVIDHKTGKKRSKRSIILYIGLLVFLLGSLGIMFFGMTVSFAEAFITSGMMSGTSGYWMYFALCGMLALMFGIFGSVFSAYTLLFAAKDNELILSMPIPSSTILVARSSAIYIMSLIFSGVVWIPTYLGYAAAVGAPSLWMIISGVILLVFLCLFELVITCILAWLLALLASKIHMNAAGKVIAYLAFFAVYYVVCFNLSGIMTTVIGNLGVISETIRTKIFIMYEFGKAASGNIGALAVFCLVVLVCLALCWFILSKSFNKIVTIKKGSKKKVNTEIKAVQSKSVSKALLIKEAKFFFSNASYTLNAGIGAMFVLAIPVVLFIKRADIGDMLQMLQYEVPAVYDAIPLVLFGIVGMMIGMDCSAASAVSLEGKSIWISQTMPVDAQTILNAKAQWQIIFNAVPGTISILLCGWILGLSMSDVAFAALTLIVFEEMLAYLDLFINLRHPNLTWSNPVYVFTQSMSVTIAIFAPMVLLVVLAALYVLVLRKIMSALNTMILFIVVFSIVCRLLMRWIKTKGSKIYSFL